METMNIALPPSLKRFVQNRVAEGDYGTVSEYIRDLIRNDQRQLTRDLLQQELLQGVRSGPGRTRSARDWETLRRKIGRRDRHKSD